MPIDLANVSWLYVILLGIFVFVAAFLGNLLSFHHRGTAALISAALFIVIFIFWTYYPHNVPLLPTRLTDEGPATAEPVGMPKQAPGAERPRNPVTDITPPKNPVTDVTPPPSNPPPTTPPAGNPQ